MPPLQLATTGDDVRLWSLAAAGDSGALTPPTSPLVVTQPHRGPVTGVQFNHNNTVVVTCGDDGYLHLQYATGAPLFTLPLSPPQSSSPPAPLTCLSLTSGSRYVACGDASARLTIWDLKRQSINRHLDGHTDEVTCIDLSPALSPSSTSSHLHIASGSASSSVLVHDLETGQLRASLTLPSLYPVRALHYSPHTASLLACGGDDGAPHLFDLSTSSLTSPFPSSQSHSSSLSALLFSPVHPSLLLSTSLSASVLFHDLSSSSVVHRGKASSAITCADWAEDGWHVVVGCRDGGVEVFDLRKEGEKVAGWKAHAGEVRSVKWQHMGKAAGKADRGKLDSRGHEVTSTPNSQSSGMQSTPFSLTAAHFTLQQTRAASKSEGGISDPPQVPVTPYIPHSKPFSSGAASKEPAVSTSSSRASTASSAPSSWQASTTASAASPLSSASTAARSPLSPGRSLGPSPLRSTSTATTTRSPSARRSSFPAPAPFSSSIIPSASTSSSSSSFSSSRRTSLDTVVPAHDSSSPSSSRRPSSFEEESKALHVPQASSSTPATSLSSSSLSDFEAMLDRRLSALQSDVHADLCNLQLDVFRQFHAQSMEMQAVMHSVMQQNAELREEMGKMREQLKLLRG